ncbi:actin-related protein ArpC3 [Volvox carteri f. nagariensis]|uniref:Actin-related protein 2/3 complex subunit 3 n=1 Tax=Volvox carteri f. nagariensis TaxID=3068 RepID=D8U9A2_VOLCA|nr:actin-related protein ArpC3 [Volvox carteri f. nagariensis]EFJ43719.1 actin-related protein ArpC3 [Volvox carteri f. nagariensis]|eukprot:XP_002955200.1 actin-related protein ArpC3 [Volvox carteri f. nagariensis]
MAYHSLFNDSGDRYRLCCGCPLIPLNVSSAAPSDADGTTLDPIDEAIELFRPNSLFKSFDIRGPGDKLLVYLILFINSCLRQRKPPPSREEARALLFATAHDRFPLPGQAGFPLGALMLAPASREEEETIRSYLRQCREEAGRRLLERLYAAPGAAGGEGGTAVAAAPNRHWLAFANRRFLDRTI